jgi:hypothetical protein
MRAFVLVLVWIFLTWEIVVAEEPPGKVKPVLVWTAPPSHPPLRLVGLLPMPSPLWNLFVPSQPQIVSSPDSLVVTSPFIDVVFTLGLFRYTITADVKRSQVLIIRRLFWCWPVRHAISFRDVQHVFFRYSGTKSKTVAILSSQPNEYYTVGLSLIEGSEVLLCRFYGYGNRRTEESAAAYADQLRKMIGVPLSP